MPIYSRYSPVGGGGTSYTFVGTAPITVTEVLGTVTTSMTQADTTTDGWLSSADWNTFNSKQSSLTFGNLTELTSSVLTITGGTGCVIGSGTTIQVTQAGTATNGYLSSADWNTFNNKADYPTFSDDRVLYSTTTGVEWRTVGTGSTTAAYPSGTVILGRSKPPSIAVGATNNIIVGSASGNALTTGNNNTLIGPNAASVLSTGNQNVVIGASATLTANNITQATVIGGAATAADSSVAIGQSVNAAAGTNHANSVIIGRFANANGGNTPDAVLIGHFANSYTTRGSQAVGIGRLIQSGDNTVVIGYSAKNGTGTGNIYIGHSIGKSDNSASGNDNVIIGRAAATSITTASNNCIIGTLSSVALTTSSGNVFIGKDSAKAILTGGGTGGNANVAIGLNSLSVNTSALGVTVIGNDAGTGSTADYSTVIGSIAGNAGAVGTLSVLVGHRAAGTGANIVSIGANATCGSGANSVAIGQGSISVANSVAMGSGATATGSNQFVCGSNGTSIQTVAFGKGLSNVSAPNTALTITNSRTGAGFTNADGSAGHLILTPSNSTGDKSGGDLIIQTAPAGLAGTTLNAYVERMRVTAAGNVGVGTNSPGYLLDVNGTARTKTSLITDDNSSTSVTASSPFVEITNSNLGTDTNAFISFRGSVGGVNQVRGRIGSIFPTSLTGALSFQTLDAGSVVEKVRISSTGNVGIGTSTPAQKLDVNGVTQLQGNLLFSADATHNIGALNATRPNNAFLANKLQIGGALDAIPSNPGSMAFVSSDAANNNTFRGVYYANVTDSCTMDLRKSRGTESVPVVVASGDRLGRISFRGNESTAAGGVFNNSSYLQVVAEETFSATARGSRFEFYTTTSGTTTIAERLRLQTGSLVINEPGNDYDTRIEGDTDTNLVFVDASTDRVGIGTNAPAQKLDVGTGNLQVSNGNLILNTAGNGLSIKEGTNAKMGTATLTAGTVTVATTAVTTNSRIFLSIQSLGTVATPQAIGVTARTNNTDFTITSADNTDTSVIAWMIVEPA